MELHPPPYDSDSGRGNKGYQPLSAQYPGTGTGYAPAAPVFTSQQQQQSSVVVLNQPAAAQSTMVTIHSPPRDYFVLTVVMMVLCGLHANIPAFVCLIPAMCFAVTASSHNEAGDYNSASSFGKAALCCNIFVIIYFILMVIGVVVVVIIYFAVGFSFLNDAENSIKDSVQDAIDSCDCDYYDFSCSCNN